MNTDINILIVEDNPGDFKLVSDMLKRHINQSFKISSAVLIKDALEILQKEKFDVILLDINLPDSRGLEGLEKITNQSKSYPVIMLTGLDDENFGMEAVKMKASDYLVKGQITENLLIRSIRYAIERKHGEEMLKAKNFELLEIDKKKTEFVSMVAHDLRTPLTSIMGFADSLTNSKLKLTEEQKVIFIGYIQEESRRLGRLISDFLDISNIEEGKLELKKQKTDIKPIICKTIDMFKMDVKDIQFKIEFENDLPEVDIDYDRIRQVLQNIIGNAIKYSPAKSIINIALKRKFNEVQTMISDQGPGIANEEKLKIFEKFYRVDSHISRLELGTGLGLAISKAIIKRHGGRIWVEDNMPTGSCFIFTLPLD
ncbi:MAG: hypothetical protein A2539_03020 [Elusimicrobia bacterium RIFOXYD2_FULL_34_15]|nr:MAG: hypothetical protein A2539_03020 [Elusimicrobia bacterium RIFOXYD2_FULL_34_15]